VKDVALLSAVSIHDPMGLAPITGIWANVILIELDWGTPFFCVA
jgi:hypothetical protein